MADGGAAAGAARCARGRRCLPAGPRAPGPPPAAIRRPLPTPPWIGMVPGGGAVRPGGVGRWAHRRARGAEPAEQRAAAAAAPAALLLGSNAGNAPIRLIR